VSFPPFTAQSIVGVCVFDVSTSKVQILNIAVAEDSRTQGVGRKMIAALRDRYNTPIEAETDDDAVGFYRKCGFETTVFEKHNTRRYACVLQVIK